MSGPLDDALSKHDRDREAAQRQLRDNHIKMKALIEDFLRRMNPAGDPGTKNMRKDFRPESNVFGRPGWEFLMFRSGVGLKIFRTGMVAVMDTGTYYYGPLENATNLGRLGVYYEEIAQEMATTLRLFGVR